MCCQAGVSNDKGMWGETGMWGKTGIWGKNVNGGSLQFNN